MRDQIRLAERVRAVRPVGAAAVSLAVGAVVSAGAARADDRGSSRPPVDEPEPERQLVSSGPAR